ncbi:MAG: PIG-L family deacetylase [Nitrospiraceae bacterium]|nr:PIG-L family deacetylase [Nitrospiraceae bacterium]
MRPPARIKWRHVGRLYEKLAPLLKASPIKMDSPERGRVLVLAPHIDDDVIGAGGSLRKHVLAGDAVKVVYFADCTEERIREAEEAADVMGFVDLEFLGYESKRLLENAEIPGRLSEIIDRYNPEFVYLPSLFDRHNDHLAVNHHLAALHKKGGCHFTVCACEVWTALVPNLLINITDTVDAKKEALSRYRSQLASNDWLDAAISLNRYRGVTSGAGAYAEGFMRYSAHEYYDIWKAVYGR